ncbi:MAG: cyclic nucleotide-binding domain-containing protein [Myxococcota bacterium]
MSVRESAAVTHVNKRTNNEDAVLRRPELCVYAVADGMGGPGIGDAAARAALAAVQSHAGALRGQLRAVEASPSSARRLEMGQLFERIFNQAHESIRAHAAAHRARRMAAALITAVVGHSSVFIAHVGNCRAYLLRARQLVQLTEDHSIAQARLRHGRLTPASAAESPDRFRLYQSVGANADMDVETAEVSLATGDVLLLCSDGLTSALSDDEILHYLTMPPQLPDAATALVAAARAGGEDNISVVLIRMGEISENPVVEAVSHALRQVFLFHDLSPAERYTIAPYMEEHRLKRGEVLVREGDPADRFYVLIEGALRLTSGRAHLADLGPGEHLGALALARPVKRAVTATAMQPARLYGLSRERFEQLVARRTHLGGRLLMRLLDAVSDRLREMTGRVEGLTEEVTELRRRLELIERAARGELRLR